ncbi:MULTISPECIES: pyrroline-5-carboxylate reductase [unclassified Legionella]|uniref:pyrroline-5-carboxylate reductase n=1 Tax=unclassified Legionella TaxID=2622702 RepID=UPI0010542CB0|nr:MULTISPECIES: pyrroline-5-carboxylate reductase [unclassified Legionella]MDI9817957.1 pyrroline-5-carboxylate reductase [Legionella sp. PL877]
MKISFIGFGNMAKAIAQSLINQKEYQLFASFPSAIQGINGEGITTSPDNREVIKDADIVILAIKPAQMPEVLGEIALFLPMKSLVISIAAGISVSWLQSQCRKEQAIIRSMPNTPIAVGKGATPLIANDQVTIEQKQWVEKLFQNTGIISWVTEESQMDPFTALSGSGPAYVFLFMEAMIKAAQKLGLDENIAKQFTMQTIAGAVELAEQSEFDISELRKKVTSPAGTTAAALTVLQQQDFETLVFNAMKAACGRARELSL